jgi:hypothetical protein
MPRDTATANARSNLRWAFLVLVFVVTMVSYADRQFLA